MSFWPLAARVWGRCSRPLAPCRSCSRGSSTRSAPATSRAWLGRAATLPALRSRIQCQREMAGTAQGDRAPHDPSGGPTGSRHSRRKRAAGRNSVRGIVVRGGIHPGRRARCRPDRARHHGFARVPNGGLIVTGSALAFVHRELIITLAAQHQLPAVYSGRFFAARRRLPMVSYGASGSTLPPRGRLCRPHPKGEKPARLRRCRPDQVRAGDQSQDRQGARPRHPGECTRPRGRSHRVNKGKVAFLAPREKCRRVGFCHRPWSMIELSQQRARQEYTAWTTSHGAQP